MNLWFWDTLLPKWRDYDESYTLSGIGTLISTGAFAPFPKVLVCGSGSGYGRIKPFSSDHVAFSWVRGPRTAKLLGLPPETAITDPACMVTGFPQFAAQGAGGGTVFVPHRLTASLALDWDRLADRAGVRIVLPQQDATQVIAALRDADLVIAESMHGAIIADAFRTPWVPVAISHHFNNFKWQDWADSMDVDLRMNTALDGPRNAYFMLRNARAALRGLLTGGRTRKAPPSGAPAPAVNPNYMEKDERDRVKGLIRRGARLFEALLARDLSRVVRVAPTLSPDGVLQDRQDRIRERVTDIERRFGS